MSEHGGTTASRVCCSRIDFERWAESVGLNQTIQEGLPDELQKLLAASRTLPDWNSTVYKPYQGLFSGEIDDLARNAANRPPVDAPTPSELTDSTLTNDLSNALFPILSVPKHFRCIESSLRLVTGEPSGADLRTPLDQLANLVWIYELVPSLSQVLKCKLQLPKVGSVPDMECDSAAHFDISGFPDIVMLRPATQRACATLVNASIISIQVLHWATAIGTQLEHSAERQVMMAMVSGLYQRRVLGFLDHFIFGTAHSGDSLRVLAGTWTLRKGNAMSTSITMYELGEYKLNNTLQIAELYLLMRASRSLGLRYMETISSPDTIGRLRAVSKHPLFNWSAEPRLDSPSVTSSDERRNNIIFGYMRDIGNHTEYSDNFAMESTPTNLSSAIGDSVQEAEWEDEWNASYREAIETLGRGEPVRLNSLKRKRGQSLEDNV
ncbi:hypothetical protein BDV93DRAFT_547731 [Ceratobasidium sp. AG-I]|nr:hypothetical protein BDV93DRAFT_547731 [Ceratobasidium sp. AG-I]